MKQVSIRAGTLFLTAVSLVLAGCGSGDDGATGPDGSVTISYWTMLDHNSDDVRATAERTIIENFMAENPSIKVKVETSAWNELPRKTILAAQAGNGPDVARVSFAQTLEYLDLDILTPLDDYLDEDGSDLLGETAVFDGKRMGIAYSPVPNGILYRTDLFEQTGLPEPKTWEDLATVLAAMTSDRVHGFGIGMQPGKNGLRNFLRPAMWGAGQQEFVDGVPQWDSAAGVAGMQFLVDLINDGVMPEEVLRLSNDDVLEGFRAGQFAAIEEQASRARHAADSDVTRGKVGLWRFPSPDGNGAQPTISSWFLGLVKGSKHPDEAWKLIQYMTSNEADAIKGAIAGELPSRASSLEADWLKSGDAVLAREFVEYLADFAGAEQQYPENPALATNVVADAMQNIFLNGISVQQALTDAVAAYQKGL